MATTDFHPLSAERHRQKSWRRYTRYDFAANTSVAPLVAAELARASVSLPIAFIEQDEAFIPAAVLGLRPQHNLLVGADGRWLGRYVPAVFRSHPFRLANTADGQQVLCIDEASGLLADVGEGETLFDADVKPTAAVQEVLSFLSNIEQNRPATVAACAALQQHQLIVPWPITLKEDGSERKLTGLYQTDERALQQCDGEALAELMQAGALTLAYTQLLSMQHLSALQRLMQNQAAAPSGQTMDLDFLNEEEDSISFDGLG